MIVSKQWNLIKISIFVNSKVEVPLRITLAWELLTQDSKSNSHSVKEIFLKKVLTFVIMEFFIDLQHLLLMLK